MIDDKLRFDVNGDGTISVEYEDRQYYRSFGNYTINELKVFIINLENIVDEAQDQLNWYNSINEVKSK